MTATVARRYQRAAGLALLGDQGNVTSDFVRSLHLPSTAAPDTSTLDGLVVETGVEALVAVAIAVALLRRGGRAVFAMAAVLSAVALGTTVFAIATTAELEAVPVGPLRLSPVSTAVAIVIAAVISIGAAAFGWRGAPG